MLSRKGNRREADPVPERSVTFALNKKTVSIDEFERFVRDTKSVLKGVARAAGSRSGDWVLTDLSYGSAVMTYAPIEVDGQSHVLTGAVVEGFRKIELASGKPSYFSERALAAVRRLSLLGDGDGISISSPGMAPATLSRLAGKNVDVLLKPARRYFGSIAGNLDVVSVHATPYVTIYSDYGDVVRCYVGASLIEDRAKELLGDRVVVTGQITTNRMGNMVSIRGDEIYEAPARHNESPSETAGTLPDLTGDFTIGEYLPWVRRE